MRPEPDVHLIHASARGALIEFFRRTLTQRLPHISDGQVAYCNPLKSLAHPTGFEPVTSAFGGQVNAKHTSRLR